jgi:thiamine-phosphate pyrophosphorylase
MIHNNNLKKFYFIKEFDKNHIKSLDNDINIIYRNYTEKYDEFKILEIKNFCKKIGKKFFLANNIKLTVKLRLDGAYIPSFNKDLSVKSLTGKKITILGSAHNLKEINQKRNQGVQIIFLSPLFKIKKSPNSLGIIKFNILSNFFNGKTVALGGINKNNIQKVKILNCFGFASISYIREIVQ